MNANANLIKSAVVAMTALVAPPLVAQERAGKAVQVQQDAFQAISSRGDPVSTGSEIIKNARVYTKQYGTMDIRLEDGTNLLVAPNASIVIDDYVFTGRDSGNSFGISLTRGALKMVSGRMPKDAYGVTTPVATIGIRGTEFWLDAEDPDLLQIWVLDGSVVARPSQSSTEFVFDAPAYATCSATSCQAGEAPPVPDSYPNDPTGSSFGGFEEDGDAEPEGEEGGLGEL